MGLDTFYILGFGFFSSMRCDARLGVISFFDAHTRLVRLLTSFPSISGFFTVNGGCNCLVYLVKPYTSSAFFPVYLFLQVSSLLVLLVYFSEPRCIRFCGVGQT